MVAAEEEHLSETLIILSHMLLTQLANNVKVPSSKPLGFSGSAPAALNQLWSFGPSSLAIVCTSPMQRAARPFGVTLRLARPLQPMLTVMVLRGTTRCLRTMPSMA